MAPLGRASHEDDAEIRRTALKYDIPCITTLSGAMAMAEGIAARTEALKIWRGLGDRMKQGENMRWLSRLHWYNGEGEAAEQFPLRGHPGVPDPQSERKDRFLRRGLRVLPHHRESHGADRLRRG